MFNKLANSISKVEMLFGIAQAISQALSSENYEKKLIDGFLSGRNRIEKELAVFKTFKVKK